MFNYLLNKFFRRPALKVCPFCGRPAVRMQYKGLPENKALKQREGVLKGLWYVGCPDYEHGNKCEIHPAASWYKRLKDAERAWNTRSI